MQDKLKLKFTDDYCEFLLNNNGGMPEEEVEFTFFEYDKLDGVLSQQKSDIHYFYNHEEILETYENLISEKLIHITHLPIACDSFGNEILLCLDQNINYGNIFLLIMKNYHWKILIGYYQKYQLLFQIF